MESVWIQAIVTIGSILGGGYALLRYMITQNSNREDRILLHHERQQKEMLEFYAKKNDHLERIATDFTATLRTNTSVLSTLTSEIKLLRESHNKK